MRKEKVKEEVRNLLRNSYFAYLCTVNNGAPHVTPIFYVYHEGLNLIYFMSSLESRKMKNILSNKNVSLTVDVRDPLDPFKNSGIMVEGEAKLEAEIKLIDQPSNQVYLKEGAIKVFKMFQEKYPILNQSRVTDRPLRTLRKFSEVLVSIKPRKIIYWGGGPKFKRIRF